MKTIELTTVVQPVEELLDLAEEAGVLIRLPNGKVFLLQTIVEEEEGEEDFDDEVARTRQNRALMEMLRVRAEEPTRITTEEARKRLGLT